MLLLNGCVPRPKLMSIHDSDVNLCQVPVLSSASSCFAIWSDLCLGGNCGKLIWPMMQQLEWGGCLFCQLLLLFSHVYHQTHLNHPFSSNNWVISKVMAENGWSVGFHTSHDFGFLLVCLLCLFFSFGWQPPMTCLYEWNHQIHKLRPLLFFLLPVMSHMLFITCWSLSLVRNLRSTIWFNPNRRSSSSALMPILIAYIWLRLNHYFI